MYQSHRGLREPHTEATERIQRLHPEQSRVHPELWRAVPEQGANLDRICGIDSEPSGEQANGQETANGMDGTRSASLAANADPRVEWGTGRDVPPLVPAIPTRTAAGAEGGCLNAPVFSGLQANDHPGYAF